jgi:hypothetical protein
MECTLSCKTQESEMSSVTLDGSGGSCGSRGNWYASDAPRALFVLLRLDEKGDRKSSVQKRAGVTRLREVERGRDSAIWARDGEAGDSVVEGGLPPVHLWIDIVTP